jgi:uncharacterized protein YjbJ (UPF0337 family)
MADVKDRFKGAADTAADAAKGAAGKVADAAQGAKQDASGMIDRASDKVQEWAGEARDVAQHAGEKVQQWAGDAYEHAGDYAGDFGREVTSLVRKHPIPALLIGFGIGVLLGRSARMI